LYLRVPLSIETESKGEEGMRTGHFFVAVGALLLVAWSLTPALATEYFVPDDPGCDTVQNCIGQASNTDIVTVKPGTYPENIDFLGKAITVRSQDGPEVTILDGAQPGFVVTFENGEGNDSVLEGFTIRSAQVTPSDGVPGGGILCSGASPTIRGNEITQLEGNGEPSFTDVTVAGVSCQSASPIIENNRIVDNVAGSFEWSGTVARCYGVLCQEGSPIIRGNEIARNLAYSVCEPQGVGIYIENSLSSNIIISGNTITGHLSGSSGLECGSLGAGIYAVSLDGIRIENNIVAQNWGSGAGLAGGGILILSGQQVNILHNTIVENGAWGLWPVSAGIGVFCDGSGTSVFENNIVAYNFETGLCITGSGSLLIDFNDVWGNKDRQGFPSDYACNDPGANDFSVDPLFVDPEAGDYHLQELSFCLDSGTDVGVTEDIEGNPRPLGEGFDRGAYEAAGPPAPAVRFSVTKYYFGNDYTLAGPLVIDDVNGDDSPDLIVLADDYRSVDISWIYVLLGNGDGTFQDPVALEQPTGDYTELAVGDLNGDDVPDLAVSNDYPSDEVSVLLGNGDGTFQSEQRYAAGNPGSIAIGDLDGDNDLDLVVVNIGDATVSVLLGNGDGTFQTAVSYDAGYDSFDVAIGDLNGDDAPDLAMGANVSNNSVSVLLGNGDGTFQDPVSYGPYWGVSVAIGDLNGDNAPDLAVTTWGYVPDVQLCLGRGDGTFDCEEVYHTGHEYGSLGPPVIGDLNGDNKQDLVVTEIIPLIIPLPAGKLVVLLGNGDGTFQAPGRLQAGYIPFFVAIDDLNGDGRPDLAVSDYDEPDLSGEIAKGSVLVFINKTGVASIWGVASTLAMKVKPASEVLNYLFVLLVPIGAMMLWKRRRRTK
jgi:hypothetical protein